MSDVALGWNHDIPNSDYHANSVISKATAAPRKAESHAPSCDALKGGR